jgi:polysaccharide chain length determinant protein (PEP-CTERM system associated)
MNSSGEREITLSEAKRALRSYWWTLPISVVVCGALGVLAATVLPKHYTSQTLVLVDQPTVSADYVKPVVTEDLNRRLSSMQEQILSRARLMPLIEKFNLQRGDERTVYIDELVGKLRKDVTVKPMEATPGTDSHGLPGFYISVTFDNPVLAQHICEEITSMLINQNAQEREQQARRTTSFLSDQLLEAKRKLDEQDAKLASFKQQYLGSLPEEEQTNLSLLTGMNAQLEANVQALSRAQQDKAFSESLLSQQESNSNLAQGGQKSAETAEVQLSAMQDQLASLRARYTPDHPDVVKMERQLQELQSRLSATPKENKAGQVPSPVILSAESQRLHAKVRQDELNISELSKLQEHIQDQIRQLQERLQASPVVEQRFKEITRNYQTALDFYNDLLKKRTQSVMASDLEHEQDSEQFRILDPPSLPDKPSFPKRSYFAGGGAGLGLALSFGLMYLMVIKDKRMYTEGDVQARLNLPVLALVPKLRIVETKKAVLLGPTAT